MITFVRSEKESPLLLAQSCEMQCCTAVVKSLLSHKSMRHVAWIEYAKWPILKHLSIHLFLLTEQVIFI